MIKVDIKIKHDKHLGMNEVYRDASVEIRTT
jgi:hypothetical protein